MELATQKTEGKAVLLAIILFLSNKVRKKNHEGQTGKKTLNKVPGHLFPKNTPLNESRVKNFTQIF
jgi:hypothetical protein